MRRTGVSLLTAFHLHRPGVLHLHARALPSPLPSLDGRLPRLPPHLPHQPLHRDHAHPPHPRPHQEQ